MSKEYFNYCKCEQCGVSTPVEDFEEDCEVCNKCKNETEGTE